jgi:glutamate synthase domain-containing protein 2
MDTDMTALSALAVRILEISVLVMAFVMGMAVVAVLYMYLADISQTRQAIRRNYPVIGRFRYLFEKLGEFFRQYFFAQDREELPFNRAQRAWVYRAAKNLDSTIAFGSTQPLNQPGDLIFLNGAFPPLDEEITAPGTITFGEGFAREPYSTSALVNISAMSFGALSVPAIRALSKGAREAGIWLNTGEGGLSPYHLEGNCDIVFQVGTAKYGVRDEAGNLCDTRLADIAGHPQVKMFEIKLSQGAKPGKGGILPAAKVTETIAAIRGIPPGTDSISPNRHRDIGNTDELLDMIAHVREVTGKPTGFKAVIGDGGWLDELCERIGARGLDCAPDFITVDSADGGTGAAPQSLMDSMGLPLKRSLPLVIDKLVHHKLRDRIRVIASGKLINPTGVAAALCIGADCVNSARGFMFALGCVQSLQCNRNTCPTGVTTHDEDLQKGLDPADKAQRVKHYAINLQHEVEVIAHSCGVTEPRLLRRHHVQMIGEHGIPQALSQVFQQAQD